jgi:histidinol-phosphate aminotransferase
MLSPSMSAELLRRGFTRRHLGKVASLLAAGAALPFYNEGAMAQLSAVSGDIPQDVVRINANENPLGPCPEAANAVAAAVAQGGRYQFELTPAFSNLLAELESLPRSHVAPFAGSSAPLHQAVIAFCSPTRSFVTADPGYEAGARVAAMAGAKVVPVPLTSSYAHDVRAMAKADPNAGLIYVCNPNNPTGTLTPRLDIEWLLANKPAGSVLLLDEAYIHFCKEPGCSDLVAAGRDVIILRTFSKLYGMAGLRAGAAMARPELLASLQKFSGGFLPTTGMAGAVASLRQKTLVAERRAYVAGIRNDLFDWMTGRRYRFVPSVSNKFMLETERPGSETVSALLRHKVLIGRVWPAWPNHVRVSIGTREEMERFKNALLKVLPV